MTQATAMARRTRRPRWLWGTVPALAVALLLGCSPAAPPSGAGDDRPTGGAATGGMPTAPAPTRSGDLASERPSSPGTAAPPLAGAQLVGGGGTLHPNVTPAMRLGDAALDQLDLFEATALATDHDGVVWILVQGEPGTGRRLRVHGHRSTALRVVGTQIDAVRELPAGGQSWLLSTGAGGDVAVAVRREGDDVTVLGQDPTGTDDRRVVGLREDIPRVGALAMGADGTLLAAHPSRTRIDAVTPDGTVHHLVGVRNFDPGVEVRLDTSLGEVTSLVALPDGRVAFTADEHDGVLLVAGGELRNLEPTPSDPDRSINLSGVTADGQLLAIAAGSGTHPQVWKIDVDTGATVTVADLAGVLPHPEGARGVAGALWAVAATADGDDLLLLADGHLWRVPQVVSTPTGAGP